MTAFDSAPAPSLLADALAGVRLAPVETRAARRAPESAEETASESDWSDAELREADASGSGAPPSASQGAGRPWAHVSKARKLRREARRARAEMRFQGLVDAARVELAEEAPAPDGVFLGDLDASAAIHVLSHLSPADRARVAACRRAERDALTSPGSCRSTPRSSVGAITPVGSPFASGSPFGDGFLARRARLSESRRPSLDGRLSARFADEPESSGHLADAAWREVDLRAAATPTALATLRSVACGALRRLDVTHSRGLKRGDLLELARASPRLRDLRCASLGDTGKFCARDCQLVLAACPSLERFECDVGVSAQRVKVDGEYQRSTAERDVADLLADGRVKIRRLKIHSADAIAASSVAAAAAEAARRSIETGTGVHPRSLDISWGLQLSDAALAGVSRACAERGGGWPIRRFAMRKAEVKDAGAVALADAIAAAANAVEAHEAARERLERGQDRGRGAYAPSTGSGVDGGSPLLPASSPAKTRSAGGSQRPTCELRWLDLGSNHVGDVGGAALGDALGPFVPITRVNLRDNHVGFRACASLGRAAVRCATLRRLDLAHNAVGDAGVAALCDGFASAPGGARSIRVLQLGFNSIGKAGAEALAEAHAGGFIDRLEHLDLACNVLGPAGLEALARMLEPRDDATERGALDEGGEGAGGLDAGGCLEEEEEEEGPCASDDASEMYASDEASDDGEASSEHAPRMMKRARRRVRSRPTIGLLSLDVAVNNVALDGDRSGVRALTRVLETNRTLRVLNMRGNDLTPEMAGDVAECLLENATLEIVNVGYNKMYNDGAWELAEALSENTSLRGLDIQRNEITDKGAAHVAALLSANAGLDEVDMRSNMLSPELVEAFGGRFGDRVNCRWQQEPPKAEEREVGVARRAKVASEGGGAVAAKRAERERRKAERLAKRGR